MAIQFEAVNYFQNLFASTEMVNLGCLSFDEVKIK